MTSDGGPPRADETLPSRQYAWAWQQRLSAEEKLALLALCTGEAEPNHEEARRRAGLSHYQWIYATEKLHQRTLIDDHGAPTYGTGPQATLDESGE